jgi:DNA-binding GntR family transcriptional regulator
MISPALDLAGPTPIYQQIRDWILAQIAAGVWPEHFKLKAEADLAVELGVSRGTVRKAIATLIEEGKLVQVHGRGTFVSSNRIEQPLAESLITFSEDLINRQIPFETRVLEQGLIHPPQRVTSLLSVPAKTEIFYLKRVRIVQGLPLILLVNYVRADHCPGIEEVDFTRYRLVEAFEDLFSLQLEWAQRTFEAQAANQEVADLLAVPPRDPIMYIEQVLYLADGSPLELSDLWLRGDHLRISARVKRRSTPTPPNFDLNF